MNLKHFKAYLLGMASAGLLFSCTPKPPEGFEIRLTFAEEGKGSPGLIYSMNGESVLDTMPKVEGNTYVFEGKLDEPTVMFLALRGLNNGIRTPQGGIIPSPALELFVQNGDVFQVRGNREFMPKSEVSGGSIYEDWKPVAQKIAILREQTWQNQKEYYRQSNDSLIRASVMDRSRSLSKEIMGLQDQFMKDYPGSFVSLHLLSQKMNSLSPEKLDSLYSLMPNTYKGTAKGQRLSQKLEAMKSTRMGARALDFSRATLHGDSFHLSDLQGKYVLLDFWGSWCKPCRMGHPHLKELYSTYKNLGFEIVAIAQETQKDLEKAKTAWMDAISEDEVDLWIHVLNNDGVETHDIVRSYGVSAFPTKILLDPSGTIIGRYVGSDKELDAQLEEIFGKSYN